MRLFLAVNLQDSLKGYISGVINKIKKEEQGIRFVSSSQMHLTLKFLGDVSPQSKDVIVEKLNEVSFDHFSLKLSAAGAFPDANDARVLWIGVEPKEQIVQLQKGIDNSLKQFFPLEKDYVPHITIGRVSFLKNKETISHFLNQKIEPLLFNVEEFFLVQSNLSSKGPEYRDLERFGPG